MNRQRNRKTEGEKRQKWKERETGRQRHTPRSRDKDRDRRRRRERHREKQRWRQRRETHREAETEAERDAGRRQRQRGREGKRKRDRKRQRERQGNRDTHREAEAETEEERNRKSGRQAEAEADRAAFPRGESQSTPEKRRGINLEVGAGPGLSLCHRDGGTQRIQLGCPQRLQPGPEVRVPEYSPDRLPSTPLSSLLPRSGFRAALQNWGRRPRAFCACLSEAHPPLGPAAAGAGVGLAGSMLPCLTAGCPWPAPGATTPPRDMLRLVMLFLWGLDPEAWDTGGLFGSPGAASAPWPPSPLGDHRDNLSRCSEPAAPG